LDLELWERNLKKYLADTDLSITFMVTFNILTVTNFQTLLEKILEWRKEYPFNTDYRVKFDTPYLKEPLQYDMNILPKEEFMPYMHKHLEFIKENVNDKNLNKFTSLEYERFRRVVDYMETTHYSKDKIKEGRKDFYNWFTEYDRRRSVDFVTTFPTMVDFYNRCKDE
jgi:hypothetical protein